ncbi:hypothetical protein Tco_0587527 [Tanacetum coccineum]
MLKFPVEGGIVTIRSTTVIPAKCRMVTEAQDLSPSKEQAIAERIKVAIHPEYPDQTVIIGGGLSEKERMELCNLLKENLDIFAWKPANMTGVPCSIAEHRMDIANITRKRSKPDTGTDRVYKSRENAFKVNHSQSLVNIG